MDWGITLLIVIQTAGILALNNKVKQANKELERANRRLYELIGWANEIARKMED